MTRPTRFQRASLALLALCFGLSSYAAGEGTIEVKFQTKLPDPADPSSKDQPPIVEATVIGAAGAPVEKFVLVDKSVKPNVEIKATKLVPFTKGNEKIAIAIVLCGTELWIGNDEVPELRQGDTPDPSITPGVLKDLKTAVDKLKFGEAGPPGSFGTIITYGKKAVIKVPMGPLAELSGQKFGAQTDYFRQTGAELVQGITLALTELHKVTVSRKVLIVLSDGLDINMATADAQMVNLKKEAKKENIETFAIVFKLGGQDPANVLTKMISQIQTVNTIENIGTALGSILARMDDRKYLTFPGITKDKPSLTWDGKPHNLIVRIDKDESEEISDGVILPIFDPPSEGGFPWLIVIASVGGFLLLLIIMMMVLSKKKEVPIAVPPPVAVVGAPPPMPEAPKQPFKTVMIGQGGDEGGFPVVGWLVPLNGAQAYQTLRLRSSGTKIGTAPPADLVINDGFMSTEHCKINCSPQGYTLVDGGSTNGCYVNDRKIVDRHELVDNDLITLGKTNFKFKSIV